MHVSMSPIVVCTSFFFLGCLKPFLHIDKIWSTFNLLRSNGLTSYFPRSTNVNSLFLFAQQICSGMLLLYQLRGFEINSVLRPKLLASLFFSPFFGLHLLCRIGMTHLSGTKESSQKMKLGSDLYHINYPSENYISKAKKTETKPLTEWISKHL